MTERAKKSKTIAPDIALQRLEALCARAEHCTYELRQKLWTWKIPQRDAEKIIDSLLSRKFVDDERFVRSFINDKINFSRWGERKILMALVAKRLPGSLIRDILANEVDKEKIKQNLLDVLLSKARTLKEPHTFEGRTKLFRYAVSRGYYPDLISEVIRKHFA